jgi:hypothetical protein
MQTSDVLLALSWVLSMAMSGSIGFSLALAQIQKSKSETVDKIINFISKGLKNDDGTTNEPTEYANTEEEK